MTLYDQAAKAKLARDKASFDAFRRIDQQQHEQAFKARAEKAVNLAKEDLANWREDEAQVSAEAADALTAAREAEDKALAAAEFAQDTRTAYLKIKDTGSPPDVAEKMAAMDNAGKIAQDRSQAAREAAKSRDTTSTLLAASREQLARAQAAHAEAQKPKDPGTAPFSDATIAANFPWMQRDEIWDQLDRRDQDRVTAVAKRFRHAQITAEEVEAFGQWLDGSLDASARRQAAQRQGVPVPLV